MWTFLSLYTVFAFISTSWQYNLSNVQKIKAVIHREVGGGRIIGGNETELGDFPYQAALFINNRQSFCGGTLISKNFVLTAAHCAAVMYNVEVILGAHNISVDEPQQVWRTAKKIIVHSEYDKEHYLNDVALIQLNESVPYTDFIQPAVLPTTYNPTNKYEAISCNTSGWGLVNDKNNPTVNDIHDVLMVVQTPVIKLDNCAEYFNTYKDIYITEANLCTSGYRNRGTCSGDSGGPLVLNGVQIGLVSFGADLCEECTPSVFTRTDKYYDWIKQHSDI